MNKSLKRILLGFLVWAVPFVAAMIVWDAEANTSWIGMEWFNALMAFTWAVGFSIATCIWFRNVRKNNAVEEGWKTGIIWYIELLVLDLAVLLGFFQMSVADFYPMILTYLNVVAISAAIGHIIGK